MEPPSFRLYYFTRGLFKKGSKYERGRYVVFLIGWFFFFIINPFPLTAVGQFFPVSFFFSPESNTHTVSLVYQLDTKHAYNLRKQEQLISRFQCFGELDANAQYEVLLCADVPDNDNPSRVIYYGQPGHVFLVLNKIPFPGDTISQSFGLYPLHMFWSLSFHKIRSKIGNNEKREYDIRLSKSLSAWEFARLLEQAVQLSAHKYHIKKYNCMQFALDLFNTVSDIQLSANTVRFPFLVGKGGSPCAVYEKLKDLKTTGSPLAESIRIDSLQSPANSCPVNSPLTIH